MSEFEHIKAIRFESRREYFDWMYADDTKGGPISTIYMILDTINVAPADVGNSLLDALIDKNISLFENPTTGELIYMKDEWQDGRLIAKDVEGM